jgi:hypothetical protein
MTKTVKLRAERLGLEEGGPSVEQALQELMVAAEGRTLAPDLDWSSAPLVHEALERHGAFAVTPDDITAVLFSFRGRLYLTPGDGSPEHELAVALIFVLNAVAGRSNENVHVDEISQ